MARPQHPEFDKQKIVAQNRRARFEYYIEDTYEAGLVLTGTEVKSLRFGEGSIAEAYAEIKGGVHALAIEVIGAGSPQPNASPV